MRFKSLYPLIGIVIFILILTKINISNVFSTFRNANFLLFMLGVLVFFLYFLIRILNWKYLLSLAGVNYSFKDTFLTYFSGSFVGLVTPGRLGDFTKAAYLKKEGHDFIRPFMTVFIERLFDVIFLFFVAYLSMFFFASFFEKQIYWMTILILILIFLLVLVLLNKNLLIIFLKILFNKFIPEKHKKKVKVSFFEFYNKFKLIQKRKLLVFFLIASLAWFVNFLQVYLFARALNIEISFFYSVVCLSIASLFSILPISVLGIGTRDAIFVFLFAIIGLSKEAAISFSLSVLFFMLLAAVIGFLCWMIKPLKTKNSFKKDKLFL